MSSPTIEAPKPEARPKLPEGWRWVRLRDICQQDRKVIANIDQRIGKPYLSLEHIESGTGEIRKTPQGKTEDEGKSATFAFDERHVLYGKLRPYLNKVALPSFAGRCTTEIVPLLPSEEVDRGFLAWLLRRPETVHYAMQGKTGSRMPRADMNHLLSALVPLPPLETQRRIAAILTEQMGAVEKARKAAEDGLEAARKLTAAHLRAVFESEEAATWKIVTIEEIADTCSGSTPLRSRKDYYNGNIPWVKTGELRDGLIENTEEHVSAVAIAETSLRLLPVNTLLIAMYGQGQTRGRTGLLAVPATTNQACFAILPNPQRFNPAFLQYWFRFSYSRLRSVSEGRGGNQPNLNGEILKAERVPLPTLETQHRIVAELNAKLEATQALIRSLEAQLEAIRALPAAILRRAFSGEL